LEDATVPLTADYLTDFFLFFDPGAENYYINDRQEWRKIKPVTSTKTSSEALAFDTYVALNRPILGKNNIVIFSEDIVAKILSGQVTMLIEPKQHPCGVYNVFSEGEIVCQIEIEKVEKWDTDYRLSEMQKSAWYNSIDVTDDDDGYVDTVVLHPCFALSSGFESIADFIQHHKTNYAPIKYAMTFKLIK